MCTNYDDTFAKHAHMCMHRYIHWPTLIELNIKLYLGIYKWKNINVTQVERNDHAEFIKKYPEFEVFNFICVVSSLCSNLLWGFCSNTHTHTNIYCSIIYVCDRNPGNNIFSHGYYTS